MQWSTRRQPAATGGARRVIAIGIDGVPYSFAMRQVQEGRMPNLARILAAGTIRPLNSSWPFVSSVAWSSFMTGTNPGKHNIYGFVDRRLQSYDVFLPNSSTMRAEPLWCALSREGKRVAVMNVPVTYPPREVNGLMVSCFLSPSLEKATYPRELAGRLKQLGYQIDADAAIARRSKVDFMTELRSVLDHRATAMFEILDSEPWDFFMSHIMETDRLHHFYWEYMERGDPQWTPAFYQFYERLDEILGQVWERVDNNTTLILLSDHGFCTITQEVYLNTYLREQGWLRLEKVEGRPPTLAQMTEASRAYSLDPGRVFVNLRGREPRGSVEPGAEYERVREQLAGELMELRDPATGALMIERVYRREEIYHGHSYENAPDLVVAPYRGYAMKGALDREYLTYKGDVLIGEHTHDDALLYVSGHDLLRTTLTMEDVAPAIFSLLRVAPPPDLDGVMAIEA
ncbi:MAG TPA: alkaline phosphatase family protein [Ktedonobacterales bacterium]|nr:alkaline phosphatase family protein [Ktedonobacterales bacterium]